MLYVNDETIYENGNIKVVSIDTFAGTQQYGCDMLFTGALESDWIKYPRILMRVFVILNSNIEELNKRCKLFVVRCVDDSLREIMFCDQVQLKSCELFDYLTEIQVDPVILAKFDGTDTNLLTHVHNDGNTTAHWLAFDSHRRLWTTDNKTILSLKNNTNWSVAHNLAYRHNQTGWTTTDQDVLALQDDNGVTVQQILNNQFTEDLDNHLDGWWYVRQE